MSAQSSKTYIRSHLKFLSQVILGGVATGALLLMSFRPSPVGLEPVSHITGSTSATVIRQETLKDAWLAHDTVIAMPYSVERQEALKDAWLARGTGNQSAAAMRAQTQEALKDAWLAHDTVIAMPYSVERQEALKELRFGR